MPQTTIFLFVVLSSLSEEGVLLQQLFVLHRQVCLQGLPMPACRRGRSLSRLLVCQGHLRLPQPLKSGHLGDGPAAIPLLPQVGIVPEARGMSASGRSLVPAKEFGQRGWWDGVFAVLVPFPCPGPATA
jgi:hypothetical protein